MQLPGPLGGCGCRLPSNESTAAFWSTWLNTNEKVTALCAVLGRPVENCVAKESAFASRDEMDSQGLVVSVDGQVNFKEAMLQRYLASPWAVEMPPQKLLNKVHATVSPSFGAGTKLHGRLMRGLESIQAMDVFDVSDPFQRTLMLSAGGPGSGKLFHTFPLGGRFYMPNAHFHTTLLARFGLLLPPLGSVCQLSNGRLDSSMNACGCCLERPLVHPYLCKAGPCRLRPHRSLCTSLAIEARSSGGHVDTERACPELFQWQNGRCQEAILDIVYHLPGTTVTRFIDVTVRCPFAARYASTDGRPAVAASAGENEKRQRYGCAVWPLSFETFGRLGPESVLHLQNIAADFVRPGGRKTCMGVYNRLRYILEYQLLFEQADLVLLSLGASSGLAVWKRQRQHHSAPSTAVGG